MLETKVRSGELLPTLAVDRVMALMAEKKLDALLFPHQKRPVVPVGAPRSSETGASSP